MKISNSYKEELKEQVTAKGEEINVKIVTMDNNKLEHLQDLLTQTEQDNEQVKTDMKNGLNVKKLWFKSYKNQKENIWCYKW